MIIKKLAVPLVNDKVLLQAEYCSIATAGISEAGFDFINSRIAPKCKIEIITGLDALTSPNVLRRIWRHYQDRITLRVYSKNPFYANVFIFDLPYRKSVAFTGSGTLTLEGLKDHEHIFYKITDVKEIEALKSWYVGYFEFAETLTENMITAYEALYYTLKQGEISATNEKRYLMDLAGRGFTWDTIKFKTQFFKQEDFFALTNTNVSLNTDESIAERKKINEKLIQLQEALKRDLQRLKLFENPEPDTVVSSKAFAGDPDGKLQSISIAYGRSKAEMRKYATDAKFLDFMTVQIGLDRKSFFTGILVGSAGTGVEDRKFIQTKMNDPEYRKTLLETLKTLGNKYWIEVAGIRKEVTALQNEDVLWEMIKADHSKYFGFSILKNFPPVDPAIHNDRIVESVVKELEVLAKVYYLMKENTFDNR